RFSHIPDNADSLRDSEATAVGRAKDGRIWVGGRKSVVDKLDPFTGNVEHVVSGNRGDVIGLTEDDQHRLWIVMQGALFRYADGKLDQVKAESGMEHPLEVEQGPDGKLYARTFAEGILRIDQDTLRATRVPIQPADEKARWGAQLTLKNGTFWYASDFGLLRLDRTYDHFEPVPGVANGQAVDAFDFTPDGMWLARSDGLEQYRYSADGLTLVRKIDASKGWPSIGVYDLAIDKNRRVWIFGRDGLWRYDPFDGRFRRIGLQEGLVSSEFARGFARMPDGYIYAPSLGGVVGFNPDAPDISPESPPLAVMDVHVQRRGAPVQLPVRDGQVQVSWRDRGLTVTARVFSFVDPASNRYRFRLSDFDNDWVDTGNVGVREFSGLASGDHALDVMAAGVDGKWSRLRQPLLIHVQAPPWVRWWAWCAYSLFFVLMVWLFLRIWQRRLFNRHRIQMAEQRRHLAEQASAAKTRFLATLSHEIRTPMTGVIGMAELLMGTPLSPVQREYTEAMQSSGSLLMKLVNDALDLARIEAGRLELDQAAFDPCALVDDIAHIERGQARKKGLRFDIACAGDLPRYVMGDAMRIKQVLLNLANNALKFTESGHVTLRADRQSDGIMFSVADTGPGISEEGQSRLFQRFEQEDGPKRNSGSGLGLAICRELVSLMGGSIELESRLGQGSTFRVRLPLPEVQLVTRDVAPRHESSDGMHTVAVRPLNILLIEDDAIVAAVVRGLLEQQGHHVRFVSNGLAALAELAHGPCDVALLDLDLPGVDGFQVARLIRQREAQGQRLPIIVVTARSSSDDEVRARELGMDGFLRKPVTGEQLASVLRGVRR
ncbi:ATP-binding protein, partial [Dyella sp.]|uniref:ATP-binding protein n=1 Tax=Dyella sp. TaxID=1869338 RepID=UPI002ED3E1BE